MSSRSAATSSTGTRIRSAYSETSWVTEVRKASSTLVRSANAEKYRSCWSCTHRRSDGSCDFSIATLIARTMARLRRIPSPSGRGSAAPAR